MNSSIQRSTYSRNPSIESFRFIAIIAVVIIHIQPYSQKIYGQIINQSARFAVPYFLIIAGYFFYEKTKNDQQNVIVYLLQYGFKLFYVYLIWFIIYTIWPIVSPENWANIFHNGFLSEFHNGIIQFIKISKSHILYCIATGGNGYQLWFLPSLGVAILLLGVSIRYNLLIWGLILSILLFIFALLIAPYKETPMGLPFNFDPKNGPFFSSIFVFIGAMFSKYQIKVSLQFAIFITFFGLIISIAEVLFLKKEYGLALTSHDFVIGTLAYGTGVAMISFATKNFGVKCGINSLGKLTLGIYVIHILVIFILNSVKIWPSFDFMKIIYCLVVSIVLTKIISTVPILRKSIMQ